MVRKIKVYYYVNSLKLNNFLNVENNSFFFSDMYTILSLLTHFHSIFFFSSEIPSSQEKNTRKVIEKCNLRFLYQSNSAFFPNLTGRSGLIVSKKILKL